MLQLSRRQFIPLMLGAAMTPGTAIAQPARYRDRDCARAIRRGMQYLYRVSSNNENFAAFGFDTLWAFLDLVRTTDAEVTRRALGMGRELARRWLRDNPRVPADADARTLGRLCSGSFAADQLGVPSPRLKEELQRAVQRFGPADFLRFDPTKEPVPDDLSDPCENCGTANARGQRQCSKCSAPVKMSDPYDTLTGALIETYTWDRYGLSCGASMGDVAQHLPRMRPYRGFENGRNGSFTRIAYAVTHVVYVFNDYGAYRLKPEWLPDELEFLKSNLTANLSNNDPDLMGEFLDSLKSLGLTDADPVIRTGVDFLLSRQNADGSWSEIDESGAYTPYHATSTAVNGLGDYAWQGERVTFPEALRRAQGAQRP